MPLKRLRACARCWIPELDGLVVGPGRHELRVRRERNQVDVTAMPLKCLRACARCWIPELDGLIGGPGRHELRVWRERDRPDPTAMPLERLRACIPIIFHSWPGCNPPLFFLLEQASCYTADRAKYKC